MTLTTVLQTIIGGLGMGSVYGMVAIGFSIVYRAMGLVNFGHTDVLMIGAYFMATLLLTAKLPFVLAILLSAVATGVLGLLFERVLRPLEGKDLNLMLIGTIGFGILLEAVAILVWGSVGTAVPIPPSIHPFRVGSVVILPYYLVIMAVGALCVALLHLFMTRVKLGIAMQAAAMDPPIARAMGVNVARCNALAFALGSAIAAVAGGLVGPLLYVSPAMGASVGIKGFAAAILGGLGSMPGAIVGGLLFGLIESFAASRFSAYTDVIAFAVFTVVMLVRPTGIFGEQTVDRA
ncbi:MAG: branched-chain amino acid ABC transporter permease [Clostridia bacterium]|nr:branched-chain amino acid ABC transporter permease [Clostridia bacterium]